MQKEGVCAEKERKKERKNEKNEAVSLEENCQSETVLDILDYTDAVNRITITRGFLHKESVHCGEGLLERNFNRDPPHFQIRRKFKACTIHTFEKLNHQRSNLEPQRCSVTGSITPRQIKIQIITLASS